MGKFTVNNKVQGMQAAVKNIGFYTVVLLVVSISLPSQTLATENPPVAYRADVGRIAIEVDPRVELIGIVFRLAGSPEFNDGTLRPYVKAIERHFGDFDRHPVVKMAAQLRNTHRMSCDGPMSLAIHIDGNFQLRNTLEGWPSTLDYRWKKRETADFLERLQKFSVETKFNEFFIAQRGFYEEGIHSCEALLPQFRLEQWFGDYFGVKQYGKLKLVLGFVNGFNNYGRRFTDGPISEKYAIIGMRPFDSANTVMFRPKQVGLAAHEFCHSFTNPLVEKHLDQLQPAGERLFAAHGRAMRMRGYQKWESVIYETAVRACVASFVRHISESMYKEYYLKDEVKAGFVWTEDMGNFLKTYESNRDKYATFESFFPEFITFLNEYSR